MKAVFLDTETGGLELSQPIIELAAVAVEVGGPGHNCTRCQGTGLLDALEPGDLSIACNCKAWRELEVFEEKLQFDPHTCAPRALEVNHYSAERWKDAKEPAAVVLAFGAFLGRHASVKLMSKRGTPYYVARAGGHNISGFDLERIMRLFKQHGAFLPLAFSGALDTLHGAVWYFERQPPEIQRPENYKLGTLGRYFNLLGKIQVEHRPDCGVRTGQFSSCECGLHEALIDVRVSLALAQRFVG